MLTPEVTKALDTLKTIDEVREAFSYIKRVVAPTINQMAVVTGAVRVGNIVEFKGRHGAMVKGKVEKLNRTTATVVVLPNDSSFPFPQRWRVPLGALKAA